VEDAMHIVLNVKGIVIRNKTGRPGTMTLNRKSIGAATVADIIADEHLELVNKDHVIANVSVDGELDVTFFVEAGRGYKAAQWPESKSYQEDGRIYLDAMFSPISKVTLDVEKTRVGSDIDYDKLVMRVYTNGAETPVDVMHYAVSVLRTQLEHFLATTEIPFNEISVKPEQEPAQEVVELGEGLKGIPVDLLLKPIEELELSVRAHNCLINAGVKRVIDLVNLAEDDVLKIKNFGRKSLNEVKDSMKAFSLSFGMDIKEDDIKKVLKSREE
jgi:DNA-directed RNA polymerase subunit alpha